MQKTPTASEVQSLIGKVRGVVASRVIGDNGNIAEVHILAGADRSAKQIVRDIESMMAAQFGVKIDRRKVSVAQIERSDDEKAVVARPQVRGVRIETEGHRLDVNVTLGDGDRVFHGRAEGIGVSVNRYRLAGAATLRALEAYLNQSCRLLLDDLVPFRLGGWDGYLASVVLLSAFGEERLVGCALVKKDEMDTVIKAVLNAVNRRIQA